jgi:mono/diheme cytochrome c family protein
VILCAAFLSGCRQDMHDQPKYKPLSESAFFPSAQSARPLVEGTVARGQVQDDPHFSTGMVDGAPVDTFPYPVTREMVDRGQERYDVFCAPCHDRAGTGRGMIVRRGYRQPPSLHDGRLKAAPPGYYFDVMTNGFGVMPDYRAQIPPADRWAITAYVRALQAAELPELPPESAEPGVPDQSFPGLMPPGRTQERR